MRTKKQKFKPYRIGIGLVMLAMLLNAAGAFLPARSLAYFANETNPTTSWAACNTNSGNTNPSTFAPLSDAAAAALVTHESEIRPKNALGFTMGGTHYTAANKYVPTDAELSAFRSALDQNGDTPVQENPYNQYVDGRDGMTNPSTDDLIQWGAHKWGIPEDWIRAEYIQESGWSQWGTGDRFTEAANDYALYPVYSRVSGSATDVYESLGISQEKWRPADHPGGSDGVGTEPLRWKSMAFNIDYQLSTVRFEYDNPQKLRTSWGDASYVPCQDWLSVGGWFEPYPWNNTGQQNYVTSVQNHLNHTPQEWTTSAFINESLTISSALTFDSGVPIPGDLNSDGVVNATDLSMLLSNWKSTAAISSDINSDGVVNIYDLSILLSNY